MVQICEVTLNGPFSALRKSFQLIFGYVSDLVSPLRFVPRDGGMVLQLITKIYPVATQIEIFPRYLIIFHLSLSQCSGDLFSLFLNVFRVRESLAPWLCRMVSHCYIYLFKNHSTTRFPRKPQSQSVNQCATHARVPFWLSVFVSLQHFSLFI